MSLGVDAGSIRRSRLRFFAFSGAFLTLSAVVVLLPHLRLQRALRNSRYVVVEGRVEFFVSQSLMSKRPESWVVRGHAYAFAPHSAHAGFDQARRITEGAYVRIADVDGAIARLEVAR